MVEGQDLIRLERHTPDRFLDFDLGRDIVKKGIVPGRGNPPGGVEGAEIGSFDIPGMRIYVTRSRIYQVACRVKARARRMGPRRGGHLGEWVPVFG